MGSALPAPEGYGGESMTIRALVAFLALFLTALRVRGCSNEERGGRVPTRSLLQEDR